MNRFVSGLTGVLGLMLMGILPASALAQGQGPDENGITPPSIASSLPYQGDPAGLRKRLAEQGTTFNLIYTNDVLANVHGGNQRGVIDQGKIEFNLAADVEKLTGWQGLNFYANVFQIHNTGRIRRDYVGGINTIAAIEANPTTRLSELWLEQALINDLATVRLGQLAADVEFFFSDLSVMFLQSDWATITAANLPSGGPAYPLSTPGVRLKIDPNPETSLLFALFNGDPAGPGSGDEQLRNRYGVNFRVSDSPLVLAEAQFRSNQGKTDPGLARTLKLGAWGHFGTFSDQRFADDGRLLADPSGSGRAASQRGNYGVYGVIDQQLYRPPGGEAGSGISLFSRISASPANRNLIDFYWDGGIVFAGMIPRRPADRFGASFIYARFSEAVRDYDRDQVHFTGQPGVVRDYEANLEMTYVFQVIPGWTLQPVLTYVWHPNGDASRDATVVGLRSMWHF